MLPRPQVGSHSAHCLVKALPPPGASPDTAVFTRPLMPHADGIRLLGPLAFVNVVIMALMIYNYLFPSTSVCGTKLNAAAKSN